MLNKGFKNVMKDTTFLYRLNCAIPEKGDNMAIKTDVGDYKKITHKDFEKLQLRVGTITKITVHPKNPKEYIILVDCAGADEDVQVVAALAETYKINELLGKQVVIICNIKPEIVGGEESQGMLLIAHAGKKKVLITTDKKCPEGAAVSGIMNNECHHFNERD
ncbi:Methionine--tRNA ligase [uncultured archaeon]|nr:Methionine--tRNA ligase [uncultured archaeon]